jgi:chromosome segregation ATPase
MLNTEVINMTFKKLIIGTVATAFIGTLWLGGGMLERGLGASKMMAGTINKQSEEISTLTGGIELLQISLYDAQKEIGNLQSEVKRLQDSNSANVAEIEALNEQIDSLESDIDKLEALIETANQQIQCLTDDLTASNAEASRLNSELIKANEDAQNFENGMLDIINSLPEPHKTNILKKIYKKAE